jgi:hypothetical protein
MRLKTPEALAGLLGARFGSWRVVEVQAETRGDLNVWRVVLENHHGHQAELLEHFDPDCDTQAKYPDDVRALRVEFMERRIRRSLLAEPEFAA